MHAMRLAGVALWACKVVSCLAMCCIMQCQCALREETIRACSDLGVPSYVAVVPCWLEACKPVMGSTSVVQAGDSVQLEGRSQWRAKPEFLQKLHQPEPSGTPVLEHELKAGLCEQVLFYPTAAPDHLTQQSRPP